MTAASASTDPRDALQADASTPERRADGAFRLRAPMQDLVADIGRDGVEVSSVDEGGDARFALRVMRLDRTRGGAVRLAPARLAAKDALVRVDRGAVVEELSATDEGIRQDFVVSKRPSGGGSLRLALAVEGARASRLDDGSAVALTLRDGRELHYASLHVTDASGRVLPASFRAAPDDRIAIVVDDRDAAYPVRIDPTLVDANWSALVVPGASGDIFAMVKGGNDLYVGGVFSTMGLDVFTQRVAKWNGTTWSPLGAGIPSGTVRALAWDASTSRLLIGGTFGVQVWDGASYSSPGLLPGIFSMASRGNTVYAGAAGGVIVTTDGGMNWAQLGAVFDGTVLALVVDPATGTLYAGGSFSDVGVPAFNVAQWNGTAWSALGAGLVSDVTALAWDATNGRLFAAGAFLGTPPAMPNRVAVWTGSTWSAVGPGIEPGAPINALAWDPVARQLILGGSFVEPVGAGVPAAAVRLREGETQFEITDLSPSAIVRTLVFDPASGAVIAGGRIFSAGFDYPAADNLATFTGGTWRGITTLGTDGGFRKVVRDAARNRLYAVGGFSRVSGVEAINVAMFDGTRWQPLRGLASIELFDAVLDPGTGDLYVAGQLDVNGVLGVARWNGTAWSGLGTLGIGFGAEALAWDDVNDLLYAGGNFPTADNVADTQFLARWNGAAWSALGTGVDGPVKALVVNPSNARLYAGGQFQSAGGAAHSGIAAWNGSTSAWIPVGKGVSGPEVSALAIDPVAGRLYVGGNFTAVVNPNDAFVNASYVAAYNIAANDWSALSGGVNNRVYSLAWDPAQGLAVGGQFSRATNGILQVVTNNIAQFSAGTWFALGSGVGNSGSRVTGLAWDTALQRLYVAGTFGQAGGRPAVLAYADYKQLQAITLGTAPPARIVAGHTTALSPATGGASGNPVVFTSLRPSICSLSGTTVTAHREGLCVIGVDQAGNGTYAPAPQKTISIAIDPFADGFE